MVTIRFRQPFRKDQFEKEAWSSKKLVCGLDEVGRGCLAGPVVAAAAILPGRTHRLLKDSKLMTEEERLKAFLWIKNNCWYSTAIIHHRLIDSVNIYQATLLAMRRAFIQLTTSQKVSLSAVVVDAMPLQLNNTPYEAIDLFYFPFGETKSSSIAAASIVAKVTRDALMTRLNKTIPGYSFDRHKGYATPVHKENIARIGHSFIHRMTYLNTPSLALDDESELQQTIDSYEYEQTMR